MRSTSKRQTADIGVADASFAARRATQPIGTPEELIDKIHTMQRAISLDMLIVHVFYGGMPRAKAEKSLRLFAEKVLPAVQAMPTPINPASLGSGEARPASRHDRHDMTEAAPSRIVGRVMASGGRGRGRATDSSRPRRAFRIGLAFGQPRLAYSLDNPLEFLAEGWIVGSS